MFLIMAPVIDGETLPENPLESVRRGDASEIPFLSGTCLDEWRLFEMPSLMKNLADRKSAVRRLGRALSSAADAGSLVDVYADARGDDLSNEAGVKSAYLAIQTDRTFRIPAIRLAEAQASHQSSTYMYLFCSPSPARRGELGACHGIELPFVFGTLDAPGMEAFAGSGPEAEKLSEKTMDAWLAFARTGDPNHPGLPVWETYGAERRSTMRLDVESTLEDAPMERERVAFEELG
jgi:para-nitrobenzyl esterase